MRGFAAALVALQLLALACTDPGVVDGDARPRGAVVIVLDTLRADRVATPGRARPTSPVLDGLAARGVRFEQAVSSSSWTLPAMAAMLAGRYATARVFERVLATSLVETLRDAGFATGAVVEGGYVSRLFGLERGFDSFEEAQGPVQLRIRGQPARPDGPGGIEHTFARARAWLEDHADGPFFLLVHTYEVHMPYRRTQFTDGAASGALGPTFELADLNKLRRQLVALGATEREYLERLYDGGAAVADHHVGLLLDALAEVGVADHTLVVVTSDHGEELGEHFPHFAGDHGHSLYDELVRVPLLVFDPTRRDPITSVPWQVRLIDVMPTVLDRLGVPAPPGGAGRSLVPLMQGEERADRPALMRLFPRDQHARAPLRTAWRHAGLKLIVSQPFAAPSSPVIELYDLGEDPAERTNLAPQRDALRARLLDELGRAVDALSGEGAPDFRPQLELSPAQRERLESLGYLD